MFDKKVAIFKILDILKEYSDKDHLLKQKDIIDLLRSNCCIELERKTVSANIDLLIDLGYDIHKEDKGVYLDEREFDETQIKFLIDAIYSSKSIPANQAKELANKLSSSFSKYQRQDYSYIEKSTEISRSTNQDFFFNINIITEAIKTRKKITFNYLEYDHKGNLIERKDGTIYKVSPYFLVNNFGKYYLICNIDKFNDHSNYRLDYICNINLTDEDIKPITNVDTLGKDFKISKYINDHVYMFAGELITAKVLVKKDYAVRYLYDWFGKNNAYVKYEDDKLYAYVKTDDRAFLYWALQYCEEFKVIEPEYLRNQMIEHAKEMLKDYEE